MLRHYFTAQSFLTRLPVPDWVGYNPDWVPPSCAWFPAVGALIGALSAALYWLAAHYTTDAIAAVSAVLMSVLLTGALHEDALADTADGMGGGRDRAHSLAIMRDSRLGSYGVVALIIVMAFRVALLSALGAEFAPSALILAHALSRASVIPLILSLPYLREQGAGSPLKGHFSAQSVALLAVSTLLIVVALDGVVALLVAAAVSWLAILYFRHKLGGITGDGFGAVIVVVEVIVLLCTVIKL